MGRVEYLKLLMVRYISFWYLVWKLGAEDKEILGMAVPRKWRSSILWRAK